jgi:hypothetical protein
VSTAATRLAKRLTLGIALAGAVATWVMLPNRPATVVVAEWRPEVPGATVRGAYHVHTRRSDGTGTVEDVAAAAGRAGLDFVVLTDHGDATRTPDPPRYVGSVLVIDAVEISTRGGHYAALGLREPTSYRLAGSARDVVEDVSRLGAAGFVTHPDSSKTSLAWKDWSLPVTGFEWINADSEWRDETRMDWLRTVLTYPWRAVPSVTAVLDRPERSLARWDQFMTDGRYMVSLAGADAHARLGLRDYEDDGVDAPALRLPSYETVFRSFSTTVLLDAQPRGDPVQDAGRVVQAIAAGRTYTSIDGVAAPARFEFFARTPDGVETMGQSVAGNQRVTLVARALAPPGTRIRLLRNGAQVAESSGLELVHETSTSLLEGERGAGFRVEVTAPGSPGTPAVPWIVSNPIFVGHTHQVGTVASRGVVAQPSGGRTPGDRPADAAGAPVTAGIDLRACSSEKDPTSTSEVTVNDGGDHLSWTWRLAGGSGPAWVALACAVPPLDPGAAVVFRARSDEPIRVSVQVRENPGGAGLRRWGRTVYVDTEPRSFRTPLDSLEPIEKGGPAHVPPGLRTLLLVVDWTHGLPGMRRRVTVEAAALESSSARD